MEHSDVLQTPTLDAESSDLLQRITEQGGGYAFSTIITLAAEEGDLRAAETAREMAWEQLHSGPSSSILPVWRDAYAMSCLYIAKVLYVKGEFKEAIRVLELGICLGGTLLKKDLDDANKTLTEKVRNGDAEFHGFNGGENQENGSSSMKITSLKPNDSAKQDIN